MTNAFYEDLCSMEEGLRTEMYWTEVNICMLSKNALH
jgi:hypothetical protein